MGSLKFAMGPEPPSLRILPACLFVTTCQKPSVCFELCFSGTFKVFHRISFCISDSFSFLHFFQIPLFPIFFSFSISPSFFSFENPALKFTSEFSDCESVFFDLLCRSVSSVCFLERNLQ